MDMTSASKVATMRVEFRRLHAEGCFVIPNPWDIGSAVYLQKLGFKALATSSSGFAFTRGLSDQPDLGRRDLVLSHFAEIVAAVDLPVNADFQEGYAASLNDLGKNVGLCIARGVAGFSIEDATGDKSRPLFDLSEAVERIKAARAAIDASGADVLLTARSECFLVGHPDPLNESVRRIQAYALAGADVLFAPCPATRENIHPIVEAAAGKPVNAIVSGYSGLSVADVAELGVRRISVGSALARAAWTGFIKAAKKIAEEGSFEALDGLIPFAELNGFFEGH
jgi:2-methylisocitrate lyase-like PEP mutase family enzyme